MYTPPPPGSAPGIPADLKGVGIHEHLGGLVSSDLIFRDETGKTVHLGDYFNQGKPVLLTLVYYKCPNLCTFILNGMVTSMKGLTWTPGKDYEVVSVSINPKETPQLAETKKENYLRSLGRDGAAPGWHFLTGDEAQIRKLADEVGFSYKFIPDENQFAHTAALYVLTPAGRISRYLYGIEFPSSQLKLALLEASNGKIGSIVDRLIMFCCRYNPRTGKYTVYIRNVMFVACAATVLLMATFIGGFWLKQLRLKTQGV